jgi:antitoxin (DNA-binding transcriptional repressor) of toxin-antitoxin stability system
VDVSISKAKSNFAQLIQAVEDGETVIITRYAKPVATLGRPPQPKGKVVFGGMRDTIKLLPGWDDPIDLDRFLAGDI